MAPDFLSRFTSKKSLSPNRINEIRLAQNRETFDDVWKGLDSSVVSSFLSNTLNFKKKKFTKFSNQIEMLLDKYTALELSRMDASCVKNDGSIDTEELNKILYEE